MQRVTYYSAHPIDESELLRAIEEKGYEAVLFERASEHFCLKPLTDVQRLALRLERNIIADCLKRGLTQRNVEPTTDALDLLIKHKRVVVTGQRASHFKVAEISRDLDCNLSALYQTIRMVTTDTDLFDHGALRELGYTVIVDFSENNCELGLRHWLKDVSKPHVNEEGVTIPVYEQFLLLNCHRAPLAFFASCINAFSYRGEITVHALDWDRPDVTNVAVGLRKEYLDTLAIRHVPWSLEYNTFDDDTMELVEYKKLTKLMAAYKTGKNPKSARCRLRSYLAVYNDLENRIRPMTDETRDNILQNLASTSRDRSYVFCRESAGGIMVADQNDSSKFYVTFNGVTYAVRSESAIEVENKPFTNLHNLRFRVDKLFLILEQPMTRVQLQQVARHFAIYSIHVLDLSAQSKRKNSWL